MKKNNIFFALGTSMVLAISSVAFYAFNIDSSKNPPLNSVSVGAVTKGASNSGVSSLVAQEDQDEEVNEGYLELSSAAPNQSVNSMSSPNTLTTNGFQGLSSPEERLLYSKIKKGCHSIGDKDPNDQYYLINPIVISDHKMEVEKILKVMYAIQNDHPEFFWLANNFKYVQANNYTKIKLYSYFSREEKEKLVEKLNNRVAEIVGRIPSNASEYVKELYCHDYIITHCKYCKDHSNNKYKSKIFNAYGCLVEGNAVCEGYTKAMQLLLARFGIESRPVAGYRSKEAHLWNLIKIDGNWYHTDVTWDEPGADGNIRYDYFNVTDNIIKKDHTINPQLDPYEPWYPGKRYNFNLPKCTSTKYNYFERNAVKINSEQDIYKLIPHLIKAATNKNKRVFIMMENSSESLKNKILSNKIFECARKANMVLDGRCRIVDNSFSYSICKNQNVISINLKYLV